MSARATRCLLCHKPAAYLGLFIPYRPARYGGRVMPTALCQRCKQRGKRFWTKRVEQVLEARARSAAAGDN